jgi:hypothetical protein
MAPSSCWIPVYRCIRYDKYSRLIQDVPDHLFFNSIVSSLIKF